MDTVTTAGRTRDDRRPSVTARWPWSRLTLPAAMLFTAGAFTAPSPGLQAATAFLAVALAASTYRLQRRREQELLAAQEQIRLDAASVQNERLADEVLRPMVHVTHQTLPVVSRHIDTAKLKTEEEITALSYRFAALNERLNEALQTAAGERNADLGSVFDQSRAALGDVVETMQELIDARSEVNRTVVDLESRASELAQMADAVVSVAEQTNILALNASIEAAHAGSQGKGFSVVAEEVRRLSHLSADTGSGMVARIRQVQQSIRDVRASVDTAADREGHWIDDSRTTINSIMGRLQELTAAIRDASRNLAHTNENIRDEISEILVSLQFQDRVSQILQQANGTLDDLNGCIVECERQFVADGCLDDAAIRAFLDHQPLSYTTEEQHRNHFGDADGYHQTDDVTFF